MAALDTSRAAASAQIEAYRRMAPEARLRVGLELTRMARGLLTAGIRKRHPEYDENQVRLAAIRLWIGSELFRQAYPEERELAP
ncbi:MAG: hypothetical protein V1750_03040 [Acidobacteriota bacterium]